MSPALIVLFSILLVAALALFIAAARRQRSAGLPGGRVVYADTGAWIKLEKPLYDALNGLTGKPDYLVKHNGVIIPVEVKSAYAPAAPYDSHVMQLAAYCLLVQRTTGQRPPHGLLHYRNRTFAVDYTPQLEAELLEILAEMRRQEKAGEASISHEDALRCARCGYRKGCEQRL